MNSYDTASIVMVGILAVLFWGDPDLMDAIIYALSNGTLLPTP